MNLPLDLSALRSCFPALQQVDSAGRPYLYLDGPGGTQVPQSVIAAMADYLAHYNANAHGLFATSRRTDETIDAARQAAADFLNAPSPEEIVFGPNMTTLTFHISRALERELRPGDEVVVTRLDHDANIAPWLRLQERGVVVRWADFHPEDCTLDMEGLQGLLNERTRLVAVGYASNAVGTITDVARIASWARQVGAWVYVDAVHYAPHGPIDVQALGGDFLVCSAYKFFGPHLGLLWGRQEVLERLRPDKVRPAPEKVPERFETGTQMHEALAGLVATVDYLADIGARYGGPFAGSFPGWHGRRLLLKAGLAAIQAYERQLVWPLIAGLQQVPGLRIWGITDPSRAAERVPTVSFTMEDRTPQEIARRLGEESIFVWDGNFYALAVTERLGLEEHGGLLRVGLVHYNTAEEVDRFLEAVGRL
ncbi:MAG: cysteine desulfurase-like protein [Chloroflexia bacterium]